MANDLHFKLEEEFGLEKADELIEDFDEYVDKLLKTGKYLDESIESNKDGSLKKKYLDMPKYTMLDIIYEYDNGNCLCELTSGEVELIPKDLIIMR